MIKVLPTTVINLPKNNHAKCPIYEHDGKYYIKSNKPNTEAYNPFYYNDEKYAEVEKIIYENTDYWYTK